MSGSACNEDAKEEIVFSPGGMGEDFAGAEVEFVVFDEAADIEANIWKSEGKQTDHFETVMAALPALDWEQLRGVANVVAGLLSLVGGGAEEKPAPWEQAGADLVATPESGRKKDTRTWLKKVTSLDTKKGDGWAIGGGFVRERDLAGLPEGTAVLIGMSDQAGMLCVVKHGGQVTYGCGGYARLYQNLKCVAQRHGDGRWSLSSPVNGVTVNATGDALVGMYRAVAGAVFHPANNYLGAAVALARWPDEFVGVSIT